MFSPLPACFSSSLPTASSCQVEGMMDPCRSKNDASLLSGKLLQSWREGAPAAAPGALQLLAVGSVAERGFTVTAISLFQLNFFFIHSSNAGNPTCNLKLRVSLLPLLTTPSTSKAVVAVEVLRSEKKQQ